MVSGPRKYFHDEQNPPPFIKGTRGGQAHRRAWRDGATITSRFAIIVAIVQYAEAAQLGNAPVLLEQAPQHRPQSQER